MYNNEKQMDNDVLRWLKGGLQICFCMKIWVDLLIYLALMQLTDYDAWLDHLTI